jgi:hypothetical protein
MNTRGAVLICVLFFSCIATVFGQEASTGTILGKVTDSTNAVIPNANVTVTNTDTGRARRLQTNADGEYTAPELQPGPYQISVEAAGFGTKISNLTLVVAQRARVDAELKTGGATETVQVDASAVALDTDTSSVSQLVSQHQVEQLPLNGRNFLNLLFIGAGAVQTLGEQGQMRGGEGNAISINGGRPESNNYTLDGMTNTDTALNTPAVILSQDAIQEFKVQSETYSAEYGFSANQINIVSKSGTNQLHGTGFEFLRNDAFDASTHFQPKKPVLRQNQFGFVLGGPVYIPKLYDGRNKTFFLANYEGWRISLGTSPTNVFVPDQAQLGGNFAASGLPAYGTSLCTAQLAAGNACMPIDPLTGNPFPGNVIPTGRFSKIANVVNHAGLIPAPNNCLSPSTTNCSGNFVLNSVLGNSTNQQTYRLDQALGRFGSVFGRYTKAKYVNNSAGTQSIFFGNNVFTEDSTSWEVSHTISLGQKNVNNIRYGQLNAKAIQGANAAPASDVSALGLSGIFTNLADYARGYPNISIGGYSATFGSPGNNPTTSDIPQWEIADSLTSIHGKHSFSIGFDFRSWVQKRDLSTNFLGSYGYSSNTVLQNGGGGANGCASVTCGTGNSTADYLLGYYSGASTYQPGPFSTPGIAGNQNQYHFKFFAPYIQDDWKATNNLTLNLGIRWDYRNTPYETNDKLFWIDTQNTKGGLCFANQKLLTDGVAPAGNGFYRYCGRNNPKAASLTPFAPRLGFAYRPFGDNKTVIRGGYGLFFDSFETREMDNSGDLYPYVVRTSLNPISSPNVPKLTDQLFPAQSALHTVSVNKDGGQFIAVIISENPINPRVQQYSFSVERELAPNTTLEVNYVGNKGSHLLDRVNINQPTHVSSIAFCNQTDASGNYINLTNGDCPTNTRRPLPNFSNGTGTLDSRWTGYSNYNAANIKLERRSADLAAVLVYTYSKSMDDKSAAAGIGATNGFAGHLDENNPRLDYARSDFDVGQRFVASYVWNLPIGRGKKFLGNVSKPMNALVGGFTLTGIATFQNGFPFSIMASDLFGLNNTFTQRANIIGNPNSGFTKSPTKWFNTAAFAQPLAAQFGTSGRNILRGPGINNFDMGLGKSVSLFERVNLQLRLESFNTFNHTQYGIDPSSSSALGDAGLDTNFNDQAVLGSSSDNFGKITSARPGRILQLGAKITF